MHIMFEYPFLSLVIAPCNIHSDLRRSQQGYPQHKLVIINDVYKECASVKDLKVLCVMAVMHVHTPRMLHPSHTRLEYVHASRLRLFVGEMGESYMSLMVKLHQVKSTNTKL